MKGNEMAWFFTVLLCVAHANPTEYVTDEDTRTDDADTEADSSVRQPPLTIRPSDDPEDEDDCFSLVDLVPETASKTVPDIEVGGPKCIPADINDGVIWDMDLDGLRIGSIIVVREDSAWGTANQEYWIFDTIPADIDWDTLGPGSITATAMEWDDIGMGGPTEVLLDDICTWGQSVGATEWEIDRASYQRVKLQAGGGVVSTTIPVPNPARMLRVFQRKSTSYYLWMDMATTPDTPEVRWYETKLNSDSGGAFTALRPGQSADVDDATFDLNVDSQLDAFEETTISTPPITSFCEGYL